MAADITYPRRWQWPNEAKLALTIGLAFEAFEFQSQYRTEVPAGKTNHFSLSYADYGWKSGAWRLFALLDEFGLKAHLTTSGLAAQRHPEVPAAAARAGHEIAGHGWVNDKLAGDEHPEMELAEIQRCTTVLTAAAGVRPVGWTSPGSTLSKNTLDILAGEGYLWSGDDASDDLPFIHQTAKGPLVILPRTNTHHNDLTLWLAPRNPPSIIWEGFKDTFDQLYAEGSGGAPRWTEITIHCHIGGRPTLIPTLRKCLAYAKQHQGVWFARRMDLAQWALRRAGAATE